jgi:hypothetical protein
VSRAFAPISPLRQRFRPLRWLAITFLLISFITRVALLVMSGHEVPHGPLSLLYAFGVGLGYDLITFIYVAWPMVLFPAVSGRHGAAVCGLPRTGVRALACGAA